MKPEFSIPTAIAAALLFAPLAAGAVLTTVATSGYNQDVVYEAALAATPTATNGINATFGARAFFEGGAYPTGTGLTQTGNTGTPGFTTGLGNTVNFGFAPFTGNNALQISNGGTNTLTLNVAGTYQSLGFVAAASCPDGTLVNVAYTINYTTGAATIGNFTLGNWGSAAGGTARNFMNADGRSSTPGTGDSVVGAPFSTTENSGGSWRMYLFETATDSTRQIASVTFTGDSSIGNDTRIFGIAGVAVPEPTSALLGAGAAALGLLRRRRHRL